jgi:hypothetical protein
MREAFANKGFTNPGSAALGFLPDALPLAGSFFFALKASYFSLLAQRKGHRDTARAKHVGAGAGAWRLNDCTGPRCPCDCSRTHATRHRGTAAKRNGTPTLAPAAPVPGLGEVLGARADTTSCRDGTFADVLSAQPLRASPSPALHEGDKGTCWNLVNVTQPRFCLSPLVRCRPKGRAQGIARQGCRASAVTTGSRVGAYPEHGPSGGDRRKAPAPRRGVISFGYFSLHEQRKVTRLQGERKALSESLSCCNPASAKHLLSEA